MSSNTENTTKVTKEAPQAPRIKQTKHMVATKVRALTGERPTTIAETQSQLTHEKAKINAQIKVLTDLVKLLLRIIEEQKEEHAKQLETLMTTFT